MAYNSDLYMHDLDRRAFDALNKFPKLVKLREAYSANYDEKKAKLKYLSSSIRLGEKQMPEIYNLLPPICDKLGIELPELYYIKSKEMNAFTIGSTKPVIVVHSKLIDKLSPELVSSVLAHECGHIACKHSVYHSIAGLLVNGLANSPLNDILPIRMLLTPNLISALLFWYRCSELSADRAAVLCDGTADNIVDMLLRINGYGENVDRSEFLKQAIDLNDFVSESKANLAIEQMLSQWDTHPRIATRAYECYEWSKSSQYTGIVTGTYTVEAKNEEEKTGVTVEDIISAEVSLKTEKRDNSDINFDVDAALQAVNRELDRYTDHSEGIDYFIGVASGIMAGMIDDAFVGELKISETDIELSNTQVNLFIQKYAELRGFPNERLKDAIVALEKEFSVAQDNIWKGKIKSVSTKNHHLADLAHHPTPIGLLSSIVVQFLRIGTFVNKEGEWHFVFIKPSAEDVVEKLAPAILTGFLNWFVSLAENKYEETYEEEVPEIIHKIAHIVASSPIILEVAKCADKWFGHLMSDMGGSKNTPGGGMGIPGIFISLLYEIATIPGLKESGLLAFVDELYKNKKLDLRHELVLYKHLGRQAIPVAFNEIFARMMFFLLHFEGEMIDKGIKGIDWSRVIPFGNRTIDRVMMIASMTFNVADTADAAVHAAIESCGSWVLFSGKFVARFNYVGAGRAAVAIMKEVSNEKKEAELIHEKLLLTEVKTEQVIDQIEKYKAMLEEKVSTFLAEDIAEFMNGFDFIKKGFKTGDSDMVIKGNVIIQKVLGKEPQFTNQKEFDDLMNSDAALVL